MYEILLTQGKFHQHVYPQLLLTQIPKAQKDSQVISVFFALLGSLRAKAARKMLVKFLPANNDDNNDNNDDDESSNTSDDTPKGCRAQTA